MIIRIYNIIFGLFHLVCNLCTLFKSSVYVLHMGKLRQLNAIKECISMLSKLSITSPLLIVLDATSKLTPAPPHTHQHSSNQGAWISIQVMYIIGTRARGGAIAGSNCLFVPSHGAGPTPPLPCKSLHPHHLRHYSSSALLVNCPTK